MDIEDLFTDEELVKRIQIKLPKLFYLAELESSRAGKIGMEVGSMREKIIIALLLYKFGEHNVETNLPITEPEADVIVCGNQISIKTITGVNFGSVKLIWTVDAAQAVRFSQQYVPSCDMLLVRINWSNAGGVYLFTKESQIETMELLGRSEYIKLPKAGTNPRGVEISSKALVTLARHPKTLTIPIDWSREEVAYNTYRRWLELWQEE